jgi:hypothetical protein
MAATPEAKAKKVIKEFLKELSDCFFFSPVAGPFAAHGIPDIVCSIKGRFVGIEVKAPGRERNTTANQDAVLAAIGSSGGLAFVASDLKTVKVQLMMAGLLVL